MTAFLDDNYEVPQTGGSYMKFEPGANQFRALDSPIIGYVGWIKTPEKSTPMRCRMDDTLPKGVEDSKHFWALPVYNRKANQIQILEITQAGIQRSIRELVKDEDWGDPRGYDITVTREGEGMNTKYQVSPKPHKPLDAEIVEEFSEMSLDLEALFENGDPFAEKLDTNAGEIGF